MDKIEITSMSSRGQVVIPLDIREQLGLREGEKFVIVGEDDTVILKKIAMPSFDNFDKLIEKTQKFAKEKNLAEEKVKRAIQRARK
ncbi:AbrB/MazE/SpoVT family DNA-binding domain-containing protein [Candidatus Woesearchaeota archaeon]|nr:AbrB/MazE/SpoVT family DNA-binding domain-containing protein [Candidatus Woesearchaeota archaeon]